MGEARRGRVFPGSAPADNSFLTAKRTRALDGAARTFVLKAALALGGRWSGRLAGFRRDAGRADQLEQAAAGVLAVAGLSAVAMRIDGEYAVRAETPSRETLQALPHVRRHRL